MHAQARQIKERVGATLAFVLPLPCVGNQNGGGQGVVTGFDCGIQSRGLTGDRQVQIDPIQQRPGAEEFRRISDIIIKTICQLRLPESTEPYYELDIRGDEILFRSVWVGQDGLNEVRGARPLVGLIWAATLRARNETIFVIENDYECGLWISTWHTKALIRSELAQCLLKELFIVSGKAGELVSKKNPICVVYDIATELKKS